MCLNVRSASTARKEDGVVQEEGTTEGVTGWIIQNQDWLERTTKGEARHIGMHTGSPRPEMVKGNVVVLSLADDEEGQRGQAEVTDSRVGSGF
ncbi:unnamed protein product [Clonostachys solani]|uniref:Uncharacterized protein n=1 Tax=Clonostachys solani TaxID=160281 RepID=A0A9P0EIV4_9HYPO|nr:unnamed protein product [Clonostachys solani]